MTREASARCLRAVLVMILICGCASSSKKTLHDTNPGLNDPRKAARLHHALESGAVQVGLASWYGPKFHGRSTASGEPFSMDDISAAHKTLPFGTIVRITNLDNGRSLEVRINDRGPFVRDRILDLSRGAARSLGTVGPGVARIELALVSWPDETTETIATPPRAHAPWVQAGAFRELVRAETLVRELQQHDPRFAVYSADGWHRVQARLRTSREARRLIAKLRDRGLQVVAVAP